MNKKCLIKSLFTIFFLVCVSNPALADLKTFTREYTYQASEQDSKVSCRKNALTQVKRLLLEELGEFIESYTEVKNFELTRDDIISLTSGIVKTEIIDEKWDGKNYWIKAIVIADPDEVAISIEKSRASISKDNIPSIKSGKEYRISFYYAEIKRGPYGVDDSNPAPDTYILVKAMSDDVLFNTGDVYIKQNNLGALLGNRNNYKPNFQGVGFNQTFGSNCILIYLMDWDGCEGVMCIKKSEDDIIGSEYRLCVGDKIGKRWIKTQGWEMEVDIIPVE